MASLVDGHPLPYFLACNSTILGITRKGSRTFLLLAPANAAAIWREAAKYKTAFRVEPANLANSSSDCAGHSMSEFSFQLTEAHFPSNAFDRPDQAPATLGQQPVRKISVLPFVLVAAVLFAMNIWIATHLQGEREGAFLFAAIGASGMPIFQSSPFACGSTSGRTSAFRLDRAEMLSLLAGK
jgi:hypothetical protein